MWGNTFENVNVYAYGTKSMNDKEKCFLNQSWDVKSFDVRGTNICKFVF